jgi:hypothetical protein
VLALPVLFVPLVAVAVPAVDVASVAGAAASLRSCAKSFVAAAIESAARGGGVSVGMAATGWAFIAGPCPATARSKCRAMSVISCKRLK